MELMTTKRVRHFTSCGKQYKYGYYFDRDVVIAIIEIQKDTIKHLESYISGSNSLKNKIIV
jgi:hypothetical protein